MNMEEARLYCLKLERDRERSWRESRQGAFEASMLSLDEHVAKFGGDFDPIRVAVDEAVVAFSSGKGEKGKSSDRRVWLKIANRVGLNGFLDAFEQKASEMRDLERQGKRLWNPAASFQKLLNRRFPKGGCS